MQLPPDIPASSAPPSSPDLGNLTEGTPPVTSQQREADFNRVFVWRGKEIKFSVASEGYYRDFRVLCGAPPLGSYRTKADFTPEAARVLYCSSLTAAEIRAVRLLQPDNQIEIFDQWVEENITFQEMEAAADLAEEINAAVRRARSKPMEGEDDIDGMGNLQSHP